MVPSDNPSFGRKCQVREVTEHLGRDAALLCTRSVRAGTIAATDAVVAAFAVLSVAPVVLTSDPDDLAALVANLPTKVTVARV